jgi:hypothetical protein
LRAVNGRYSQFSTVESVPTPKRRLRTSTKNLHQHQGEACRAWSPPLRFPLYLGHRSI